MRWWRDERRKSVTRRDKYLDRPIFLSINFNNQSMGSLVVSSSDFHCCCPPPPPLPWYYQSDWYDTSVHSEPSGIEIHWTNQSRRETVRSRPPGKDRWKRELASKPSTGLILLNGMIVIFVPTWIHHIDWNNSSCCTHLTLLVWHGNSYCSCRLRTTNLIASVSKLVCQDTSIQSLEGLSLIVYGFRFCRKHTISTRPVIR